MKDVFSALRDLAAELNGSVATLKLQVSPFFFPVMISTGVGSLAISNRTAHLDLMNPFPGPLSNGKGDISAFYNLDTIFA